MIGIHGAREFGKLYAGNIERRIYLLSTTYGKLKELAAITLFRGTRELILPDARKFKAIAKAQGIDINYHEYFGTNHVFPVYPIPEAKEVREIFVETINKE